MTWIVCRPLDLPDLKKKHNSIITLSYTNSAIANSSSKTDEYRETKKIVIRALQLIIKNITYIMDIKQMLTIHR